VAVAYFTVALTADIFGVHFTGSHSAFPPRKKDRHPLLVTVSRNNWWRCLSHCAHRNRKCFTDSLACPHAHWSDSETPIRWRYSFNLAIPVRSWASIPTSVRLKLSYSRFVCFPGNALSNSLVYLPTPLGSSLFSLWSRSVVLIIVALAPIFPLPTRPTAVACFAAFLALALRVDSS
jgi:hypothetical protein